MYCFKNISQLELVKNSHSIDNNIASSDEKPFILEYFINIYVNDWF